MIIYILFQQVLTFDLPKDTYPLRQNEQTLKYYIILDNKEYVIDLNNEFSVTDINGVNQECNINYQCQYCDQFCRYTFIDQQDSDQNGTLQELVLEIENIQGNKQIEEFIALHSINTNQIGFGMRRLQNHQNFTFPQNTFVSNVVSLCFSSLGFIHKQKQKNINNSITIPYFQHENVYSFKLKHIQLGFNSNINIENVNIQIDSLNPFTQLPKDVFSEIANYYKQFGFSIVNQGYLSIHENKFIISDILAIKIYINQTFYLEYQPYQFLYYSGEYIQLPFKQSKKKSIILGVTFLNNVYLTINQNEQSFSFSQIDCQSFLVQNQNTYHLLSIFILLGVLLLFAILFKLCKKAQAYIKITQVQEVELQSSRVEKEKEEESQI
ncbi:unnamed protein product [Paramecium primaurelia]|uniref:Transmembrane protein n=1 Tax=Paramecium primaurelia TaxID=5886 RepID=A0A8S1L9U4_PARPR|nr:unnamed protein product [Paramecium primaurelia]